MERLRKLRESKNITQKEMSDFLGVDRTTYVKYETGSSEPNFLTLAKLADYFNVTTDYLLGREDVKKTPPSDDEGVGMALQGRPELAELIDCLSQLDDDQLRSAKDYLDFILSRDFLGGSDSPQ